MPTSQDNISAATPLGVQLVTNGATFKLWAPGATAVHLKLHDTGSNTWNPAPENQLFSQGNGYWAGFVDEVQEGDLYRFWVDGLGGSGFKRDPRATELELTGYPIVDCVVRKPGAYPWHDSTYSPPAAEELIIYQFHVGVYYASDGQKDIRFDRVSKFLDVIDRVEYLANLGITAIEPLPIVEWQSQPNQDYFSRGYNNTDFFSPEMDYCVTPSQLDPYVAKINALLARKGKSPLLNTDLVSQVNQVKALIDLCHVYGIAVLLDVVYNHAGGPMDDQSMRFLDYPVNQQWWDPDLYFIGGDGWAGGRIFNYADTNVQQFITDNAKYFLDEYHVDGFRYDEVRVITNNGGYAFCQQLITALHQYKPGSIHISEYWNGDRATAVTSAPQGLGFNATWDDGLRTAVRDVINQSTSGKSAFISLDGLRENLKRPQAFALANQAIRHLENHDLVDADRGNPADIQPRIPALADPSNHQSWYARSRTRVATGLLLTAPGIPMFFMGEEFMEDKPWHNNPKASAYFIYWDGLNQAGPMRDFLKFTRELCWLRRRYPALQGEGVNPYFNHNQDRIIAFQRWVEGSGQDVLIVASLSEDTYWHYQLPVPVGGYWYEVFNSDAYDSLPADDQYNPNAVGNPWGILANGPSLYNQPTSASLVIPANSVLVFARERK